MSATHGVAWRPVSQSHVNENPGCSYIQKKQKKPSVGVKLRAGGDPHMSETPGWSASDMRQWPKQKMHRHPISPTGVLLLSFLTCSKSVNFFLACSKLAK